jgi:murein DD-endopeptidase MepM/ murein hydrolase activator NlpD
MNNTNSHRFPSPATVLALLAAGITIAALGYGYATWRYQRPGGAQRDQNVDAWIRDPQAHAAWAFEPGIRCGQAPFEVPTHGFIGYLWDDSFRIGHRHQGIDIFGGSEPGVTPVFAAYSGYLTRLEGWKASLIVRIPNDPLDANRQIWTYYTHMADPQGNSYISDLFPIGTSEKYVTAGTLLGYQGNFSGTPGQPVGVHLHFSIVLSEPDGSFRNETLISNTLDPSSYFGIGLNANQNLGEIPTCRGTVNDDANP